MQYNLMGVLRFLTKVVAFILNISSYFFLVFIIILWIIYAFNIEYFNSYVSKFTKNRLNFSSNRQSMFLKMLVISVIISVSTYFALTGLYFDYIKRFVNYILMYF